MLLTSLLQDPATNWDNWKKAPLSEHEREVLSALVAAFLSLQESPAEEWLVTRFSEEAAPDVRKAIASLESERLITSGHGSKGKDWRPSALGLLKSGEGPRIEGIIESYLRCIHDNIRTGNDVVKWDELRKYEDLGSGNPVVVFNIASAFQLTNGGSGSQRGMPNDWSTLRSCRTARDVIGRSAFMAHINPPSTGAVRSPSAEPRIREVNPVAESTEWVRVTGVKLGEGGQATTFHVHRNGVQGVKKELHRPKGTDSGAWQKAKDRAAQEIDVLRGIQSPHVLRVIDSGVEDDVPWMVTEYQPLGSLHDAKDVLKGDAWRVLRLARDVAVALSVVHAKNVIHRDVKPKNILLRSLDHAVLGDFGIAHVGDGTQLTATAEKVAPRWFGPPEADGGRLDNPVPSFDVYSLGKVIYWTLTGGREFRRERFQEGDADLVKVLDRPNLEPVNVLLGRMIVEDPDRRFQTMDEVVRAIDETLATLFGGRRSEQDCEVCGVGRVRTTGSVSWTFSDGQSSTEPLVHFCDQCGHVRFHSRPFLEERLRKQNGISG